MTGSGSFWRACCRFKGQCGPCRDHGRVRDGSSTGSTSAPRRPGAPGRTRTPRARGVGPAVPVVAVPRRRALLARNAGHCPRRGFACRIPVTEDQESARRRRGGEGGREYSFAPASCTKRTVVERAFASYKQWRAPATRHGRTRPRPHNGSPHPHILTWRTCETCPRGRVFEMFPVRCPPRSSCRAARMDWRRPVRAEWCAA